MLISLFSNFSWKTPRTVILIPIFVQKTSNLSKLHYIKVKNSQEDALFSDFLRKKHFSLAHIRPFSKNHTGLMPIYCRKNVHPLKNTMLSYHFVQILWKNQDVMPIFGQKCVDSVKTTLYYGLKKLIWYPFSDFLRKNHCSNTHILWKNAHSLKTDCFHVIFFFMKNPMLPCPYLVQKTSILSKEHYIMGQKSQ